jgi:peptidoglycan/xylan/chitin deacetylase (PgdA/CDA1 family)
MFALVILCAASALAAAAWLTTWRREGRPGRIVVLLYHRLFEAAEYEALPVMARNFGLVTARFREHLERLRAAGHTPVSADDVLAAIEQAKPLPRQPVLITFDDGCESVYSRALPILRELGFPAALFVTADPAAWIFRDGPDAQRRVSDEEIRALDAAGVRIGSHALSHDPLQTMSVPEIERELGESQRVLERALGKPVRDFAVPLNWYGDKVRAAAVRLGYRAVWTSDIGTVHVDSDPFHLRRLNVEGWMTGDDLLRSLAPASIVQRRVIAFGKRFPARLIGPRVWLPLRSWLFASPLAPMLTLRGLRRALLAGMVLAVALAALLALRAA